MAIPFGQPWITEEDRLAVYAALRRLILTHDPETEKFATEFSPLLGDATHCLAVSSFMPALQLTCLPLDIGPGDEVSVPALTHVAASDPWNR
jgi:perosamine synthetase